MLQQSFLPIFHRVAWTHREGFPVVSLHCILPWVAVGWVWGTKSHVASQTTQAGARTEGQSLKTGSGTSFQRTTSTQDIKLREADLVLARSLHHYILVSLVWKGSLHVAERESLMPNEPQTPQSIQSVLLQDVLWQ